MIALLEPARPPGFVSGGYRYQDELVARLVARALGHRLVVTPERLAAVAAERLARGERVVVDGLFAELLGPLPRGVVALLHMVPRRRPWCEERPTVIATAATTADRVAGDARSVHVVRPGLDDCFVRAAAPPRNAMPRVLCVGTVCRAKGQHLVVDALGDHACEIVMLGDRREAPPWPTATRAVVTLSGCVPVQTVAHELRQADLFVSASRDESFGMAVAEAAACGVPVLAFATGEIASWVTSGANGWLVDAAASDAEFRCCLRDLVASPDRLLAARRAAVPSPRRSWDAVADEFVAVANA